MSLGKIVLSSNTAGAREFIRDGENGFIFKDQEEFENKLRYVIGNYSKLSKISKSARESVSKLTWGRLAEEEEKLYKK